MLMFFLKSYFPYESHHANSYEIAISLNTSIIISEVIAVLILGYIHVFFKIFMICESLSSSASSQSPSKITPESDSLVGGKCSVWEQWDAPF